MNILERLEAGILTTDAEGTGTVARELAEMLPEDCCIGLSGELGAGKTTFVKGLAAAWGITANITSPTYNIFSIYPGPVRQLVHMDAYRLNGPMAMDSLMIEDFLQSPFCLIVEWPENVEGWLPSDSLRLKIDILQGDGDRRRIRLQ